MASRSVLGGSLLLCLFFMTPGWAEDLDSAWRCDKGYTEILWCEKTSGAHDLNRLSYCQRTDPQNSEVIIPQLVIVRESSSHGFSREVARFEELKEERYNDQTRLVFYFKGPEITTEDSETSSVATYKEYRFTPRLSGEDDGFSHKIYQLDRQIVNKLQPDGRWKSIDVVVGLGPQNEPNLLNCYKPE